VRTNANLPTLCTKISLSGVLVRPISHMRANYWIVYSITLTSVLLNMSAGEQPTLFLSHGGGPMPFLGDPSHASMVEFLSELRNLLPSLPKAICVVSAHWEEENVQISTGADQLLYDYYGFPPQAYELKYQPPGDETNALRAKTLIEQAGFKEVNIVNRGFDHGVFIPLKLMFPEAKIPVFQVSLLTTLNASRHIKLGEALNELRKDGVLIVGSGMSFHNMRVFGENMVARSTHTNTQSVEFHEWLKSVCKNEMGNMFSSLSKWEHDAPYHEHCHPRSEHLVPLMVAAGAAGKNAVGNMIWEDSLLGAKVGSLAFGL
jgi:4,5-DOPA dioxygenase extradiol